MTPLYIKYDDIYAGSEKRITLAHFAVSITRHWSIRHQNPCKVKQTIALWHVK